MARITFAGAVFAQAPHTPAQLQGASSAGALTIPGSPPVSRASNEALINGLILGPLFLLAGARGMKSQGFSREVKAAMFAIGMGNVLGAAATVLADTVRPRGRRGAR